MSVQSCPSSTEIKKKLKSTYNLSDDEAILIYEGLIEMRRSEKEQLGGRIKGNLNNQHGGVKCNTLNYYYRNALVLLAFGAGISACFLSTRKAEIAKHFFWTLKDMFDPRYFRDSADGIKSVTAGLAFLEKITKFLIEFVKKPSEGGATMGWVTNIFLLLCEVDENKKTTEEAKIDITKLVKEAAEELLKSEGINYTTSPFINYISNDSIIYNKKKELKILVGDTIITISPSVTPAEEEEPPALNIFKIEDPEVLGYNANALGYNANALGYGYDMSNPDSEEPVWTHINTLPDWSSMYTGKKGGKRIRKKTNKKTKRISGKSRRSRRRR